VGDAECGAIHLSFNLQLRVEFKGAPVTSDAGLIFALLGGLVYTVQAAPPRELLVSDFTGSVTNIFAMVAQPV